MIGVNFEHRRACVFSRTVERDGSGLTIKACDHCEANSLAEAANTEALEHVGAVNFNRSHANLELAGDALVGIAGYEAVKDLPLAQS